MRMKVKEKKSTFTPLTIVLLCVLVLYALSMFYLLYWGVVTSLKINAAGFEASPFGLLPNIGKHYEAWVAQRDLMESLSRKELIQLYGPSAVLELASGGITLAPDRPARKNR